MQLGDFTPHAVAYGQARPGYPAALVDELVSQAGVQAGDPVADLGAGTGIFTALLHARGFKITAIEPNDDMRRQAPELPGVVWVHGTFEATGLPDESQRWVAAAQAFHWAKPPQALPEMRRILQPGCCFTVFWNERQHDKSAVLARTREAIRRHIRAFDETYRDQDWAKVLTSTGDFTGVVYREAHHVVPMSRDRYLNLWRSHNQLTNLAGPERFAAFLQEVADYLGSEKIEMIDVPYLCRAWTVRRT